LKNQISEIPFVEEPNISMSSNAGAIGYLIDSSNGGVNESRVKHLYIDQLGQ
jgi:hypothetical protein